MREELAVNVSAFGRMHKGREAPMWWGIVGLILVESTVVACFIWSYFYLWLRAPAWPPAGVAHPELTLPTVNVLLLLASAGTMWYASREINRNHRWRFVTAIFASVGLASIVLVVRWFQFLELDFQWDDHAYGSIVWTITGFHFVHVVSAILGTAIVGILGILGFFDAERQLAVVVDTLYWYFVAFVWVPFYFVLYWMPRLW